MQPPINKDLRRFLSSGGPTLVFTLGTAAVRHAGHFYRQSVKAAEMLGKRAVLLTGAETGKSAGLESSNDVIAVDYAPFSELMPLASVNIHQGGAGTTGQALRAGNPILVVPFAHDQPDNASRCARSGVAEMLERSKYNANAAAKRLERLLNRRKYAQAALAASDVVKRENGTTDCLRRHPLTAGCIRRDENRNTISDDPV